MEPIQIALICCIVLFTFSAAWIDWRTKKLPNKMTVPAFAAGVLFHVVWGAIDGGAMGAGKHLLFSLGGFATGFAILFLLWVIAGGGGGDVKFMGALGAWLGPTQTLIVFLVGAVLIAFGSFLVMAGSFLSIGAMRTKERYLSADKSTEKARAKRRMLPFAVSTALATWIVLAIFGAPELKDPNESNNTDVAQPQASHSTEILPADSLNTLTKLNT